MIVKVCGMRDSNNIRQVDSLQGVDWMGFIFYPKSSRFVGVTPTYLPQHLKRVGVFVNASLSEICSQNMKFSFDFIQLHGNETPAYCRELRAALNPSVGIIKMVPITTEHDLSITRDYEGIANYFLFETKCQGYGGSGQSFDWNILLHYQGNTPFLLTGGITSADAEKIKAFHHSLFAGIDLNSGFETAPAMKDPQLIQAFIQKLK